MEEIIKLLNIIVWPLSALIFGTIFIIIFRKSITIFIKRIKSVGKTGITTETPPEAQSAELREKAVEKLMKIDESPVRQEAEDFIIKDLSSKGLGTEGGSVKVLIRRLAATQLLLEYEQIFAIIYGSQIALLKQLNEVAGQGRLNKYVNDYFSKVKTLHQGLDKWTIDGYLDFLFKRNLIGTKDESYHITIKGVDFLTWIVRAGRTEDLPL